jgi:V8-like Glu-specific endopeptidase
VTAAHCIYDLIPDPDTGQPPGIQAISIVVVPGQDIDDRTDVPITEAPFGSYFATVDWFSDEWRVNRNEAYDYAILRLVDNGFAGRSTGVFGVRTSNTPLELFVNLAGYPGDKIPDGAMWESSGAIAAATEDFLSYQIDTAPGNSGSPIWVSGEQRQAVGVHTVSIRDPDSGLTISNRAVRINSEVFDVLQSYRQQGKVFLPLIRVVE